MHDAVIPAALGSPAPRWPAAWPVAAGLLAVLGPSVYALATGLWLSEDHSHGIIVLAALLWMLWSERAAFSQPVRPMPAPGWALLGLGAALYVLGRSQDILLFEVGAFIPLLAGAALLLYGAALLRRLAFFFVFLLFLLPFAGFMGWISLDYVQASWSMHESSREPGGLPGVYLLKSVIPLTALLLILQAIAELLKRIERLTPTTAGKAA